MSDRRRELSGRLPTEEELALWQAAMRDTVPLGGRRGESGAPSGEVAATEAEAPSAKPEAGGRAAVRAVAAPRRLDPHGPVDLDRRTWQRLRRGRMPIEGRIDLHGMTQEQAYRALASFLPRMRRAGARCVLVITGRGLRSGGVLRQMVPRWLDTPGLREMVLTWAPARIEHGGEGALYVLLRRRRGPTTAD